MPIRPKDGPGVPPRVPSISSELNNSSRLEGSQTLTRAKSDLRASSFHRPPSLSRLSDWGQQRLVQSSSSNALLEGLQPPAEIELLNPIDSIDHPAISGMRQHALAARQEQQANRFFIPQASGTDASGAQWGQPDGGPHGTVAADRWAVHGGDSLSLQGNRNGISGNVGLGSGDSPLSLTGFSLADAASLGIAKGFNLGAHNSLNLGMLGIAGSGLGGGALTLNLATGPLKTYASVIGLVSASAGLKVLEMYEGSDPARAGKFFVEWRQRVVPTFGLEISGNMHTFGMGGRLLLSRSKQVLYRIYLAPEQIGTILSQQDGKKAALFSGLMGLHLKKLPLHLFGAQDVLAHPERGGFLVGESMSFAVAYAGSGGLSLGTHGLRSGVFGTYAHERELTVSRASAFEVELVLAPKRTFSSSANLDAAIVAEAYAQHTRSQAQTSSLIFNLQETGAHDALQSILAGTAPWKHARFDRQLAKQAATAQMGPSMLPKGVRWGFREHAQRRETSLGGGLPVPKIPFKKSRWGGLSLHRAYANEESTVHQDRQAVSSQSFSATYEAQMLHRGPSTTQVMATVYRSSSSESDSEPSSEAEGDAAPTRPLNGILTELTFTQNRVVGNSLNRNLTAPLVALDDTRIKRFTRRGHGQAYRVTAQRFISATDMTTLAAQTDRQIHTAAHAASIDPTKLLQAIRSNSAEGLGRSLASERGRAVGAVHKLLGSRREDLKVVTDNDAVAKAMRRTSEMFLQYNLELLAPGSRNFRAAQKCAKENEKRLTLALNEVNDDQVLRAFEPDALIERLTEVGDLRQLVRQFIAELTQRQDAAKKAPGANQENKS